jgi:hypothetical protein
MSVGVVGGGGGSGGTGTACPAHVGSGGGELHILPFAIVNILLQALDLYSFEKYFYRLNHQWLASFFGYQI